MSYKYVSGISSYKQNAYLRIKIEYMEKNANFDYYWSEETGTTYLELSCRKPLLEVGKVNSPQDDREADSIWGDMVNLEKSQFEREFGTKLRIFDGGNRICVSDDEENRGLYNEMKDYIRTRIEYMVTKMKFEIMRLNHSVFEPSGTVNGERSYRRVPLGGYEFLFPERNNEITDIGADAVGTEYMPCDNTEDVRDYTFETTRNWDHGRN